VGLESILGFTKTGDRLRIVPRVPRGWHEYTITYRYGASTYTIVIRPGPESSVEVDGRVADDGSIALVDDGAAHEVRVTHAPRSAATVGSR
jgi:cellobiose phosphorylase